MTPKKSPSEYLLSEKIDLIINVVDSTLLARSLELTSELLELGLPLAIALNMQDEAEKRGLKIDHEKLEKPLGVPVVPTAALHGKGVRQLMERCSRQLNAAPPPLPVFPYTAHIEALVQKLAAAMPEAGRRAERQPPLLRHQGHRKSGHGPGKPAPAHRGRDRGRLLPDPRFSPARLL